MGITVVIALVQALELSVDDLLPPAARRAPWDISTETFAVFSEIASLPAELQHQLALIVRAYIVGLPQYGQKHEDSPTSREKE